jgi:hypothetical protein
VLQLHHRHQLATSCVAALNAAPGFSNARWVHSGAVVRLACMSETGELEIDVAVSRSVDAVRGQLDTRQPPNTIWRQSQPLCKVVRLLKELKHLYDLPSRGMVEVRVPDEARVVSSQWVEQEQEINGLALEDAAAAAASEAQQQGHSRARTFACALQQTQQALLRWHRAGRVPAGVSQELIRGEWWQQLERLCRAFQSAPSGLGCGAADASGSKRADSGPAGSGSSPANSGSSASSSGSSASSGGSSTSSGGSPTSSGGSPISHAGGLGLPAMQQQHASRRLAAAAPPLAVHSPGSATSPAAAPAAPQPAQLPPSDLRLNLLRLAAAQRQQHHVARGGAGPVAPPAPLPGSAMPASPASNSSLQATGALELVPGLQLQPAPPAASGLQLAAAFGLVQPAPGAAPRRASGLLAALGAHQRPAGPAAPPQVPAARPEQLQLAGAAAAPAGGGCSARATGTCSGLLAAMGLASGGASRSAAPGRGAGGSAKPPLAAAFGL